MAAQRDPVLVDALLVASARLGDRRAFGTLVLRWQKRLIAHAWRLLRDEEGARDAVQEAWAEIVRGLQRLRDDNAFGPWAYRIVSRRCARQIGRAAGRRRLDAALAAQPEVEAQEPAGEGERLGHALRTLPPAQQAAVALFYLEDMSVAEVAVALDVPAGTVKTRLMHARQRLRSVLEGDE
jgi:RNA polymerase sigma-70 factor (ECF subfamily)